MAEIKILLLMMAIPLCLYLGLRARMKKEERWKGYLVAAGGAFVLLAGLTKG